MKAIEQYFHVVPFTMLYKVVLTFKSVDEAPVCDHSNESYSAVFPHEMVYFAFFVCTSNGSESI